MAQMETVCPHCSNMLTVENEWIGVNVECPICKQKFVISTVHAQGFTPPENVLKPAREITPEDGNLIASSALINMWHRNQSQWNPRQLQLYRKLLSRKKPLFSYAPSAEQLPSCPNQIKIRSMSVNYALKRSLPKKLWNAPVPIAMAL